MTETLESVLRLQDKVKKSDIVSILIINGKTIKIPKDLILCGKLGDLAQIGNKFQILNLLNPIKVVRLIKVCSDSIKIDFFDGKGFYSFPKDTQVFYEQWSLDRGSYLIWVDFANIWGKLATECDLVTVI